MLLSLLALTTVTSTCSPFTLFCVLEFFKLAIQACTSLLFNFLLLYLLFRVTYSCFLNYLRSDTVLTVLRSCE